MARDSVKMDESLVTISLEKSYIELLSGLLQNETREEEYIKLKDYLDYIINECEETPIEKNLHHQNRFASGKDKMR